MTPIANITSYNDRMRRSMLDKIFFMKHHEVEVYFDYGCADGSMIEFMQQILPESFYIGYDNDPEMIELARAKNIPNAIFYTNFNDAVIDLEFNSMMEGKKVMLVLSSVIHEVYSYLDDTGIDEFWNRVFKNKFDYIAIRDMFWDDYLDNIKETKDANLIRKYGDPKLIKDFEDVYGSIDLSQNLVHFLLKYRYTDNWDRELNENYLGFTYNEFKRVQNEYIHYTMISDSAIDREYEVVYWKEFTLPFIRNQVKLDYKLDLTYNTHVKMVLKRHG